MKNKKLIIALATVALVAVMGVGGTLAYFTDSDEASNVFTLGSVGIELTEDSNDEDAEITDEGISYDHILPGDEVSKIPTITVDEDSADVVLRVKIEIVSEGENAVDADIWADADMPELNTEDYGWYLAADGYYYHTEDGVDTVYSAGDEITIFDTTTIPTSWDNNFGGKTFQIKITAYAVQADNFDGAWSEAFAE